jgi:hypothetical protein
MPYFRCSTPQEVYPVMGEIIILHQRPSPPSSPAEVIAAALGSGEPDAHDADQAQGVLAGLAMAGFVVEWRAHG